MTHVEIQDHSFRVLDHVARVDPFVSRYFDTQASYKYLFELEDHKTIETTAYLHSRHGKATTLAVDISTMVGCPVGCHFCAAASFKYQRRLTAQEIVLQAVEVLRRHDSKAVPKIVCSFQGIGEPSLIPHLILAAGQHLYSLDERIHVSIGTTGTNLSAFDIWSNTYFPIHSLMISITASISSLSSINAERHHLNALLYEAHKLRGHKRVEKIKFNYILIDGTNDRDEDLDTLISLFQGSHLTVRISSLNGTSAATKFGLSAASYDRALHFAKALLAREIDAYVFGAFSSINTSCGQLAFERGVHR